MRSEANAVARIDDAVAVDGAGDNDAARVAVVTDRLRLTIAMKAASCIAPGDTGSSHVRSTALTHSKTFWAHFENCATYNRWGEADKLAHLKASLVGDRRTSSVGFRSFGYWHAREVDDATSKPVQREPAGRQVSIGASTTSATCR